jgi:hypothetical protein
MKKIKLTKGYVALVDDEDYERVVKAGPWFANVRKDGVVYAIRNVKRNGKRTMEYMHQFVTGKRHQDHRNRNKLDNCRLNFRSCNQSQNSANANKRKTLSSSLFKGVSWDKVNNKWKAQIMLNYKSKNLGRYKTEAEAANAYKAAAKTFFGEFANAGC